MARGFAADIETVGAHVVEHVAIADRSAREGNSHLVEITLETKVGHHCCDDAAYGQPSLLFPALRDHCEELIPIDHAPTLIDHEDTVGITIERNTDIGPHLLDLQAKGRRLGGSAFAVDVEAVGFHPYGDDLRVELAQRLRRHPISCASRAIDHHAQPPEREIPGQCTLGEFDVAILDAIDALGTSKIRTLGQPFDELGLDQSLDLKLDLV